MMMMMMIMKMNKPLSLLSLLCFWLLLILTSVVSVVDAGLESFEKVARHYYPAGYKEGTTEGVPDLFGYGFGALERSYYDHINKVFYGGSEIGYVIVSDYANYPDGVHQKEFVVDLEGNTLTDIKACNDLLFTTTKDDPNPGYLNVYKASMRDEETDTLSKPTFIQSIQVGYGPDHLVFTDDCNIVITANEGEGDYSDELGLINPPGSVSIVRGPFDLDSAEGTEDFSQVTVTDVPFDKWTDEELIDMGVHLPLSLNALKYWNTVLGNKTNFDTAIESYTTASVLEPEYLAFNSDQSKVYVSMQENNAMVIVDIANNVAESIHSYGLKDWSEVPTDIVEDGACELRPQEGLYSTRSPDGITSFTIDGIDYIVTANEGDDLGYGDFEEKVKGKDIFQGFFLGFENMTAIDSDVFDPNSVINGASRFFNSECSTDNFETPLCAISMRFTVGSEMIDYSNPQAPIIKRLVSIGGRGITIYKVTKDESGKNVLEQVWDSADDFERQGCRKFPWAHNAIQDEEFAPIHGELYNYLDPDDSLRETIEELNDPQVYGCEDGGDGQPGACPLSRTIDGRSQKDGPSSETVVVGEACDSTYAVTVGEKNSVGYVYDIADVSNPTLVQVFHLSPVSENLNPGIAYKERTLGEIDAESIQFLPAEKSPTGNASVLISGAFSGTASLWEFVCNNSTNDAMNTSNGTTDEGASSDGYMSSGYSFFFAVMIFGFHAFF